MRIEMYGLVFEAPTVTFYLWSPWRSSALEHRLFEEIRSLPQTRFDPQFDELRVHVADPKTWKTALTTTERILKGWQEEASDGDGTERRIWRWLLEADTDGDGYDHNSDRKGLARRVLRVWTTNSPSVSSWIAMPSGSTRWERSSIFSALWQTPLRKEE